MFPILSLNLGQIIEYAKAVVKFTTAALIFGANLCSFRFLKSFS